MQIDGLHWIQIEHFTSAVLVLLNFKYGVSTLPVQHNHSTMPVAFYLSIDVRVTHVLNNALESFLFKRAQYGKIVFTAFTIKKVKCSKFTKYYFNKKKVNIISIHKQINFSAQMFFQKLIQASDGSRCKSDSVSCLPAPWCTTITDLNGCRTCECNSEFMNEIVFSCPSYKAIAVNFF